MDVIIGVCLNFLGVGDVTYETYGTYAYVPDVGLWMMSNQYYLEKNEIVLQMVKN